MTTGERRHEGSSARPKGGRVLGRQTRHARVAVLREDVRAGRYRVPAWDVAASLLRHLGLAPGGTELSPAPLGTDFQQR